MTRIARARSGFMQRARRWRALFLVRGLLPALCLTALLAGAPAQAQTPWTPVDLPESCQAPDHVHGRATVAHVFDGDTVRLDDGTRVRLIGLDTPEFHHRNPDLDPEPFAQEAHDALSELLASYSHQAVVVHDRELHDRFRRLLAHLFTPDGQSITALMLAQGLATRLTIPPNDWNLDCYRDAERRAGEARLGIWALPEHRLFNARDLPRDAEGFRRVEGRVVRIGESSRAVWINLEGDVALRVDHPDLANFPDLDVRGLENMHVRARGHVYNHRGQPRIRIRHPANLEVLEP